MHPTRRTSTHVGSHVDEEIAAALVGVGVDHRAQGLSLRPLGGSRVHPRGGIQPLEAKTDAGCTCQGRATYPLQAFGEGVVVPGQGAWDWVLANCWAGPLGGGRPEEKL